MSVVASGVMGKWGMILYRDLGWTVSHRCKKNKFAHLMHKPVWGDKFYAKYAKQLAHWKDEPKCIRCWESIPPMLLLMLKLNDAESIRNCNEGIV
jgi:polyferredoxin